MAPSEVKDDRWVDRSRARYAIVSARYLQLVRTWSPFWPLCSADVGLSSSHKSPCAQTSQVADVWRKPGVNRFVRLEAIKDRSSAGQQCESLTERGTPRLACHYVACEYSACPKHSRERNQMWVEEFVCYGPERCPGVAYWYRWSVPFNPYPLEPVWDKMSKNVAKTARAFCPLYLSIFDCEGKEKTNWEHHYQWRSLFPVFFFSSFIFGRLTTGYQLWGAEEMPRIHRGRLPLL